MVAVAFTGVSNSGKTTLIEKIAKILAKEYKVLTLKNDPKDKANFDVKGKDSYKFFNTGADVLVTSPYRTTFFSHQRANFKEILHFAKRYDFLLVEGLKTLPLPRIGIFRKKLENSYFNYIKAAAVSEEIDIGSIPKNIEVLPLNDIVTIIEWIKKNGKRIEDARDF
jgi:molybdopterin-guanine dinucleotide biosynthesis protein B